MGPVKIGWEPVRKETVVRLKRTGWVFFAFLFFLLFRAFTIQVLKPKAQQENIPIYSERTTLLAKRGLIYDRNMHILAMDVPSHSAALDNTLIKQPDRLSLQLAEVLGGDPDAYCAQIERNPDDAFVSLKKDLTRQELDGLRTLHAPGLILMPERKRTHPCPSIAGAVLGWTNAAHQGVGGIEQSLNALLRGEDGWEILQRDGKNRNHASPDCPSRPPKNGLNVVLTLDQVAQSIVEEELEGGMLAYRAKGAMAVLLDPFSGEILAMATVGEGPDSERSGKASVPVSNRVVQSEFEPGSTLKVVTVAAALEEGLYLPHSLIHCENGVYRLGGRVIHDHEKRYGYLTVSRVVEYSSNIGIAKIAKALGKKTLFRYMQNFGFGTSTGLELPGETPGKLWPIHQWTDFTTATIAFGQGISVTSIQLACMMSAVANGGLLVKPRAVLSVSDENGGVVRSTKREIIRRVISEQTSAQMRDMLEKAVNRGNAGEASVKGIRIAGKTGTAQKSLTGYEGYAQGVYTSSFAGFWPADSPRFVLVVVLEEPQGAYYAAQSCAPIFSNIVKRMIGLASSPISPEGEPKEETKAENRFAFSGYTRKEPPVRPESESEQPGADDLALVPRMIGLSVRQALQLLAIRGIEASVEGSGMVREQQPDAGDKVTADLVCRLVCR